MPVETGYVGKHKVNVLIDSGYSAAVVEQSLVESDQMTGKSQTCILIDGTVKKVDVANVCDDTPFYKRQLQVLCMENPIYDFCYWVCCCCEKNLFIRKMTKIL